MTNQVPGLLSFYFGSAILLTVVISLVLLAWYRRRVANSMRGIARAAEAEGAAADGRVLVAEDKATGSNDAVADDHSLNERRLRTRLIVVYGAGGAAAAAVSTALFLIALGDPLYLVRTFAVWYIYCWPIVPTLAALLAAPQRRALLAFGGYVLVGAVIVGVGTALPRFALGRVELTHSSPSNRISCYSPSTLGCLS